MVIPGLLGVSSGAGSVCSVLTDLLPQVFKVQSERHQQPFNPGLAKEDFCAQDSDRCSAAELQNGQVNIAKPFGSTTPSAAGVRVDEVRTVVKELKLQFRGV